VSHVVITRLAAGYLPESGAEHYPCDAAVAQHGTGCGIVAKTTVTGVTGGNMHWVSIELLSFVVVAMPIMLAKRANSDRFHTDGVINNGSI
jgi:hypothetical protein